MVVSTIHAQGFQWRTCHTGKNGNGSIPKARLAKCPRNVTSSAGSNINQNGDGELCVAAWNSGTVRKNATVLTMRTHTEAIARSRPQSFFIRLRSQYENRDQAVAAAQREPDGARGAHTDDGDEHAAVQDVLLDGSSAASTHW